jgi:hypothetical protein
MADVENADRDFTETTSQSYGSKLQQGCMGALIGFLLFFGSGALLFWNEGRAIRRQKDLKDGKEAVIEFNVRDLTNTSSLGGANKTDFENKLIHVIGDLSTNTTVQDPIFGVSGNVGGALALKLRRSVQMYQWKENKSSRTYKDSFGTTRTETTYTYEKVWSSQLIDSSIFKEKQNPSNPSSYIYDTWQMTAQPILLGGLLTLDSDVADSFVNWYEPATSVAVADITDNVTRATAVLSGSSGFFVGNGTSSSSAPGIGDSLVDFEMVLPDTVSCIGLYKASTITTYSTTRGGFILLLQRGTATAAEMFTQAELENQQLTWGLRFAGFFLMFISVLLMLQPFADLVDIIPFIGDCMEGAMEKCLFPLIAFIVAFPLSLFIISIAWVVYRPVVAIPICLVSLGLIVWGCKRGRDKKHKLEQQQQQHQQQQQPYQQGNTLETTGGVAYASPYSSSGTTEAAYASPYSSNTKPNPEPDVAIDGPEDNAVVGDFYKPSWAK